MELVFKDLTIYLLLIVIFQPYSSCSAIFSIEETTEEKQDSETVVSMPRMDLLQTFCKMKQLNVTISGKGCQPQTVKNNFCFGVCHSFYIPNDREVEKVQDACTPTQTVEQYTTLVCRKKRKPGMRRKRVKVTKIIGCGCSSL